MGIIRTVNIVKRVPKKINRAGKALFSSKTDDSIIFEQVYPSPSSPLTATTTTSSSSFYIAPSLSTELAETIYIDRSRASSTISFKSPRVSVYSIDNVETIDTFKKANNNTTISTTHTTTTTSLYRLKSSSQPNLTALKKSSLSSFSSTSLSSLSKKSQQKDYQTTLKKPSSYRITMATTPNKIGLCSSCTKPIAPKEIPAPSAKIRYPRRGRERKQKEEASAALRRRHCSHQNEDGDSTPSLSTSSTKQRLNSEKKKKRRGGITEREIREWEELTSRELGLYDSNNPLQSIVQKQFGLVIV